MILSIFHKIHPVLKPILPRGMDKKTTFIDLQSKTTLLALDKKPSSLTFGKDLITRIFILNFTLI